LSCPNTKYVTVCHVQTRNMLQFVMSNHAFGADQWAGRSAYVPRKVCSRIRGCGCRNLRLSPVCHVQTRNMLQFVMSNHAFGADQWAGRSAYVPRKVWVSKFTIVPRNVYGNKILLRVVRSCHVRSGRMICRSIGLIETYNFVIHCKPHPCH
jgi:hypothetical protein